MAKRKRIMCILLAGILSVGLLGGCSGKGDKDSDKNKSGAKGRYVEKDMELPKDGGTPIGMYQKDKKLWLYMLKSSKQGTDSSYGSYVWEDGKWSERKEEAWLNDAAKTLGINASQVCLGQDGKLYAFGMPLLSENMDAAYGSHILKSSDDGSTVEDITPEDLKKVGPSGIASMLVDMDVLEDGSLAVAAMGGQPKVYRDGQEVFSAESLPIMNPQKVLKASGNSLAIVGADGKTINIYDGTSFEENGVATFDEELPSLQMANGEKDKWYLLNGKGIHQFQEKGSIAETLMEGSNGVMGMSNSNPLMFQKGEKDEFYAIYSDSSGAYQLKNYVYDAKLATVPDKVLKVYGLKESATVSQAVYEFQKANPDVKVEYTTALQKDEEVTADVVKSLNTELVSGNGADVLILDGLPIDSYIEKGILSDMTKLIKALNKKGVLTDVIGNTAKKDGKTYALPARIGVPAYYGTDEENKALESLEALHNYITNNPDKLLFGNVAHDTMGRALLNTMYSELEKKDGKLDEEKLTGFLEDWMKLCEMADTKKFEEEWKTQGSQVIETGINFSNKQFIPIASSTHLVELTGLDSMMMPYAEMEQFGQSLSSLKEMYVPYDIAGINASSKQQELAEDFIKTLFGDKVQGTKSSNGYPVSEKGLESAEAFVETDAAKQTAISSTLTDPATGEITEMNATYPSRDKVKGFNDMIKGLKTPYVADRVISQTILEEMENLYSGSVDAAGAAKAIIQKVNTYLEE